jgi:hypothetical protein
MGTYVILPKPCFIFSDIHDIFWRRDTHEQTKQTNSVALSPRANYTDWATATCRRNLVSTFVERGGSAGQRGGSPPPPVVNLSFRDRIGENTMRWNTWECNCKHCGPSLPWWMLVASQTGVAFSLFLCRTPHLTLVVLFAFRPSWCYWSGRGRHTDMSEQVAGSDLVWIGNATQQNRRTSACPCYLIQWLLNLHA